VRVDPVVLAAGVAMAAIVAVLFGIVPSRRGAGTPATRAMNER